jgi:hypothetical protein
LWFGHGYFLVKVLARSTPSSQGLKQLRVLAKEKPTQSECGPLNGHQKTRAGILDATIKDDFSHSGPKKKKPAQSAGFCPAWLPLGHIRFAYHLAPEGRSV